ncbi:flavodoxin domain-containing protein [Nesterenkonia flava]|uniref:Flavodoxin domain-containing protein n=1 Tax=Nesterenkonia flava TaxID=469799 RepID=A0ABU1FUK4_9MICC|nr:flavodoxin domain-containing protein [Nesterenkonia flava]MDR5712345.1 flavodoxin domain-containing protein [Nesterenkonia flava]
MTTMVVVASKHGSTAEIGERIAATLSARGVSAHVKDVGEAGKWLYETDNVVVGIPVYRQKLLGEGTLFLEAHRTELTGKPLFLFAVGGGESLAPELTARLKQFPHREIAYFRGAIDSEKLSFFEKLQLKVAKAPTDTDLRDWPAIEDWAHGLLAYGIN